MQHDRPPWHLDKAPDKVNPYQENFVVKSPFWKSGKFEFTKGSLFCSKINDEKQFFMFECFRMDASMAFGWLSGNMAIWISPCMHASSDSRHPRWIWICKAVPGGPISDVSLVSFNISGVLQCFASLFSYKMSQDVSKFQPNERIMWVSGCFRRFAAWRPSIAELYSWRYRDLGNLPNVLTDERHIWFSSF